ncbi:hypothetical protein MJN85_29120, partial [Salmonella enterica subsp. enterica serovar Anatum]|nr:hypothetical protein [Salmonella enterica subsp. enterica serovar Anatum]
MAIAIHVHVSSQSYLEHIDYQQHEAWTWEHQALVRARVVYGDPQLTSQFDAVRRTIMTTA